MSRFSCRFDTAAGTRIQVADSQSGKIFRRDPNSRWKMEISFTDRELDIMGVLWDRGPSTVAEVRAALPDDLAYTTVLTVLRILESKGYVGHVEEGRAHRFHAEVERSDAGGHALNRLVRKLFRGSPEQLLTHLLEDERIEEEDLRRMRQMLDEHLDKERDR